MMDEQLQRRISEHLDGRLAGSDEVNLLRQLMRDPRARSLHDAWQANDRAAALALRAVVDLPARPFEVQPRRQPRRLQIPWAQLLATAAAVVLAVGAWAVVQQMDGRGATDQPARAAVAETPAPSPAPAAREVATADAIMSEPADTATVDRWWRQRISPVAEGKLTETAAAGHVVDTQTPQNARQISDRALLGVIDRDENKSYWLDVRQEQTVIHAIGGEM